MELEIKRVNSNLTLENQQKSFLESKIGKIINTTLDIGLRYILPDIIEDEVINIKNTLIKEGWEKGLNKAIEECINIGKSTIGIFTGNFENINQIKKAVNNGGVIDSTSELLDNILNKCAKKGLINIGLKNTILKGKNILIDNISSNIEEMLEKQENIFNQISEIANKWRTAYENKDFKTMSKEYENLEKNMSKIVPIEKLINEVRVIENIHNIIKNNGGIFNIKNNQIELANILTK